MKILIIGRNSFVAQYFIEACKDNEIDYFACSHLDIPGNLNNFNWVVNFTINPKFFTDKYSESIDQDALIVEKLSKSQNQKYAMISSRMVYGCDNFLTPSLEGDEVKHNNNSIYGSNKIFSEQYCRSIMGSKNLLIARGSNIFGYELGRKSFAGTALDGLLSKSEILLDISEKTVRDFIPVNDFAIYLMQLISKKCIGVYNVGSGIGITLEDLCNSIIKGYGCGAITTIGSTVIKDQFVLDNQKLLSIGSRKINKVDIMKYAKHIGVRLKIEAEARKNNV